MTILDKAVGSIKPAIAAALVALASCATSALAGPPEIRSSASNRVPSCVTPERLMAFVRTRNDHLEPKFANIAALYKVHGDAWQVRWDYAFFQMVIETNYLLFRRGDGNPGDVSAKQNNFAGIGATGGGVPGDSYRDVNAGVLAQIQHLVAYSGEHVDRPVAPRTQLAQDDIISESRRLGRPVTFGDLRNRWAADRNYARSIEIIADRFRDDFCKPGGMEATAPAGVPVWMAARPVPAPQPAARPNAPQASVAAPAAMPRPATCRVLAASYGGSKTFLIRAVRNGETHFTALSVIDGFEHTMVESYLKTRAPGGEPMGEFATSEAALQRARALCRSGAT